MFNIIQDNIRIGFFQNREDAQEGLKFVKKGFIKEAGR